MADLLPNGERALILAPAPLSRLAFDLLDKAGIQALTAATLEELGSALDHGAGLAILDEQTLDHGNLSPLQRYLEQQPAWSDLPVVLLTHVRKGHAAPRARPIDLGNLFELRCPFDPACLLALARASLRARRRQYAARNQQQAFTALQHRVEQQLRQLREDPPYLHQARKMEAIGQLAGGVAHDFNNLLTGIGGSLELIDKRLQQGHIEALPGLFDLSRQALKRAASLTHSLLAFSSRQSLDSRAVRLQDVLSGERLSAMVDPQIVLRVRTATDLWPAHADPQQLQEALGNLLRNACDAMPNGGRLTVQARNQQLDANRFGHHALPAGDYVRLSVVDTGCGMPPSTLERAFDPFYTTKPTGQGTGLGLSMVYGFSKQSRGHVALSSRIGHGTRVDLYLPRYNEPPMSAASPTKATAVTEALDGTILVVEDDATVRTLVQQSLAQHCYRCTAVENANAALALLRNDPSIVLLVSDVGLPGMNGRQLAEIARTLRPGLNVLFITGYAENAQALGGFLDPGMQMISKPFEFARLLDTIAQMLGKATSP